MGLFRFFKKKKPEPQAAPKPAAQEEPTVRPGPAPVGPRARREPVVEPFRPGPPQRIFCQSCGFALRPQDRFCPECGRETISHPRICSRCGSAIPADRAICPVCGDGRQNLCLYGCPNAKGLERRALKKTVEIMDYSRSRVD